MLVKLLSSDILIDITPIELEVPVYKGQATKGPWNDEPNAFKFSVGDYPCIGLRMWLGHWSGYVGSLDKSEVFAEPWNGLSFLDKSEVLSRILNLPGDMFYWNGFTCAGDSDFMPGWDHATLPRENYKTLEFVVDELYYMVVNKPRSQCRTVSLPL